MTDIINLEQKRLQDAARDHLRAMDSEALNFVAGTVGEAVADHLNANPQLRAQLAAGHDVVLVMKYRVDVAALSIKIPFVVQQAVGGDT